MQEGDFKMNRRDLVNEVYWKLNAEVVASQGQAIKFTKKDIELILKTSIDYIAGTVAKGEDVVLQGLGSFARRPRAGRLGVNPSTGERIEIPAKKVVKFRPSLCFQEAVNASPAS
jgi:nucleoid DNA-binding protein